MASDPGQLSPLAPHPVLTAHYRDAEARQAYVNGLFDRSAEHYERITWFMSLGTGSYYRRYALQRVGLRRGQTVIDLACGTGQVGAAAKAIVGDAGSVIGVDPSDGMRAVAERRHGLSTIAGTSTAIPLPDGEADLIVMGYALRHVEDLHAAFTEMRRVVRPGGTILLMELSVPPGLIARAVFRIYLGHLVPTLALLCTGSLEARRLMKYYWSSVAACVEPAVVLGAMRDAGLVDDSLRRMGPLHDYVARRPAE